MGRLLGEYERMTRDEGAALRARDFSALSEIHAFKMVLLRDVIREGAVLGLDRHVGWFEDCLAALAALERENINLTARALQQLTTQRSNLDAARTRLRGLGQAYRNVSYRSSSRLFAA